MIRLRAQAAGSMLDPINLAGWIVRGLVARRSLWAGMGVAMGWSVAMEALVAALNPGYPFGYLLPARLLAGAIVCGAVASPGPFPVCEPIRRPVNHDHRLGVAKLEKAGFEPWRCLTVTLKADHSELELHTVEVVE